MPVVGLVQDVDVPLGPGQIDGLGVSDLANQEKVTPSYMTRLLRLATLSPEIKEDILHGRQPQDLTAAKLMRLKDLPYEWVDQLESLRHS